VQSRNGENLPPTVTCEVVAVAGGLVERVPLCVDLDGTLIFGDLALQSLIWLVRANPFYLLLIVRWMLRGRSVLKHEMATRVRLDPSTLRYDRDLIDWIRSERSAGRAVWLCTGANERLALMVAEYLKTFDGVLASNREENLTGRRKAMCLVRRFGERGFDYCANERKDTEIWKHARAAVIVHGSPRLAREVARIVPVVRTFSGRAGRVCAWWRAIGARS
jgi:phosphoserine phosphatase